MKVLFLCVHNSARSQMAEAFLKLYGSQEFEVESAGLEAGQLNPLVVEAMFEEGIDISGNATKNVFDFFREGRFYDTVITVCDEANAERCPVFPSVRRTLHWSFEDPSTFTGSHESKLARVREVRDLIKEHVVTFIQEGNAGLV